METRERLEEEMEKTKSLEEKKTILQQSLEDEKTLPRFEDLKSAPPGLETLHQNMQKLIQVVNEKLKPDGRQDPI